MFALLGIWSGKTISVDYGQFSGLVDCVFFWALDKQLFFEDKETLVKCQTIFGSLLENIIVKAPFSIVVEGRGETSFVN